MDLVTLLQVVVGNMLIYSTPLILTALGGIFSERSGIVNIGLEGTMVIGAFASAVFNLAFASQFGSWTPWVALIVAAVAGMLYSAIHAFATVYLRADHIISGTVLNLLAPALTVFLCRLMYNEIGQTEIITNYFGKTTIPVLSSIPIIGKIFFTDTFVPAFLAVGLAFVCSVILNKTKFGLRLRSVGEHPQAADTLGINVYHMRFAGVLISGFLAGIGGAIVAQSITLNFSATTITGQGFIAMAAMIFGKWNSVSVMLSALLFGLAQSLGVIGNYIPVIKDIPSIGLTIAPYLITIIVLVGFIGKSEGPAANGKNYVKSK